MRGDSFCGVCDTLVFAHRRHCPRCHMPVASHGIRVPDAVAGSRPRQLPSFPPGDDPVAVVASYRRSIDAKIKFFRASYEDASGDAEGFPAGAQWETYTCQAQQVCSRNRQAHDPALYTDEALAVFICGNYPPEYRRETAVGTQAWYSGSWLAGLQCLYQAWPSRVFVGSDSRPRRRW